MPRYHTGEAWTPNNTTSVGTGVATAETDLQTLALPAAALTTGDLLRITASGTTSGSAGTKTVRLYFGATIVGSVGLSGATGDWKIDALVVVTGAATQKATAQVSQGNSTSSTTQTNPTETIANAITVKTTGTTTNSGDEITSEMLVVEIIPA